jgi:hypothetical protein
MYRTTLNACDGVIFVTKALPGDISDKVTGDAVSFVRELTSLPFVVIGTHSDHHDDTKWSASHHRKLAAITFPQEEPDIAQDKVLCCSPALYRDCISLNQLEKRHKDWKGLEWSNLYDNHTLVSTIPIH